MEKKRLGILGNGYLSGIIANAWKNGLLDEYELVGIAGRTPEKTRALAEEMGCAACLSFDELLALKPDYIAEAASVAAVKENAEKALSSGANLVVLSIGAFADAAFYERVKKTAAEHGTRVYIASGAVGGFDMMRTITLMGQAATACPVSAEFLSFKGPNALRNTPLFEENLMDNERKVFQGNAKEAIAMLPTKVNVAVATSLASADPENTQMEITSIPGFVGDEYKITVETEGYRTFVDIYSKTSAIAGWSVVSVLQNIVSPIVF